MIYATQYGLWIASDNSIKLVGQDGLHEINLLGPHANYVHSIKFFGQNGIGVADTGNSRVLIYSGDRLIMRTPLWRAGIHEGWILSILVI